MMSDKVIQRLALGEIATIGTLYDSRRDCFLPSSLLASGLPTDIIIEVDVQKSNVSIGHGDTYQEKFKLLGIGADLSASIFAGLVSLRGYSQFLTEQPESNSLHATIYHKVTTFQDKLNLASLELKNCLAISAIQGSEATLVVGGIEWGSQCIVTARHRLFDCNE